MQAREFPEDAVCGDQRCDEVECPRACSAAREREELADEHSVSLIHQPTASAIDRTTNLPVMERAPSVPPLDPGVSLDGFTFAVLGGGGGIGSEVVRSLARRNARVLVGGRDQTRLDAAAAQGPGCSTFALDATSFSEVEACLRAAAEFGAGRIAGVALCVGSLLLKPAHATSADEWNAVIATNLTTAFAVVRAAAKTMRQGGSVVLCSSAAASVGLANHEAIAAAKAGIEGLVRAAAATHAARGLRFNAVAPGLVRTPLAAGITGNVRALEASERMHPMGRIGEPADIAAAITWLLGPDSSWVTGQVLHVDGGLSRVRPVERS